MGVDQVARWVVAPSLPALPGRDLPQSRNWAGYTASSGRFSAVSATWVVPGFAPDSPAGADAIWVGIGGVRGNDLIQAGTQETVSGRGSTQYAAWIETLPQASHPVPLAVNAGDSITISIEQQTDDAWRVVLVNNTTTQSYQTNVQYRSSLSSAEWIVEAPSICSESAVGEQCQTTRLANFGTTTFTSARATAAGGHTGGIADTAWAATRIQLVSDASAGRSPFDRFGTSAVATPGTLAATGDGFDVTYAETTRSSGSTPPYIGPPGEGMPPRQ
jgi:hypothetical protein